MTRQTAPMWKCFAMACMAPFLFSAGIHADEPATESEAERLSMELSRLSAPPPEETAALIRSVLMQSNPDEPEEFWDAMLNELDFEELERKMAPIYARYLSEDDMRGAIAFFKSPSGQNWVNQQANIATDTVTLTQEWMGPAILRIIEQAESGAFADSQIGDKSQMKVTVASMREIGTAMMSWLADRLHERQWTLELSDSSPPEKSWGFHKEGGSSQTYRVISHAQLESLLVPTYIAELPELDGWGHPFQFAINHDLVSSQVLGLRSPGKDGIYESDDHEIGPFPIDQPDFDVLWADGYFARWPD